jgi:hypothetical protein
MGFKGNVLQYLFSSVCTLQSLYPYTIHTHASFRRQRLFITACKTFAPSVNGRLLPHYNRGLLFSQEKSKKDPGAYTPESLKNSLFGYY